MDKEQSKAQRVGEDKEPWVSSSPTMMTLEQLLGLLAVGVKKGASDIHLEAGYPPSYRIRGDLFTARMERLTAQETTLLAQHILGKEDPFFSGGRHDVDRGFAIQPFYTGLLGRACGLNVTIATEGDAVVIAAG